MINIDHTALSIASYILSIVFVIFANIVLINIAYSPVYKSQLTMNQFVNNYKYLYNCNGLSFENFDALLIDSNGKWKTNYVLADGSTIGHLDYNLAEIRIITEDNIVKGAQFSGQFDEEIFQCCYEEIVLTCMTLLKSQGELSSYFETIKFTNKLLLAFDSNFVKETEHYIIEYNVENEGMIYAPNVSNWFSEDSSMPVKLSYTFTISEK